VWIGVVAIALTGTFIAHTRLRRDDDPEAIENPELTPKLRRMATARQ